MPSTREPCWTSRPRRRRTEPGTEHRVHRQERDGYASGMSTPTLYAALAATVIGTAWLLPMGAIRMLAYRSGEIDHTPGMRRIAMLALSLGCLFAVSALVLAIMATVRQ